MMSNRRRIRFIVSGRPKPVKIAASHSNISGECRINDLRLRTRRARADRLARTCALADSSLSDGHEPVAPIT